MVPTVFEHARDPGLVAEELEAVGIGHAGPMSYTVLSQHLIGPSVACPVIGDAVTDIPTDAFDLLPLTQTR